MASTKSFWDKFYAESEKNEWYFELSNIENDINIDNPCPFVLHAGCGTSLIATILKNVGFCAEFDFSMAAFNGIDDSKRKNNNIFIADILRLPLEDSTFDIVVEKGLFDSITCKISTQKQYAIRALNEYHRVLSSSGVVYIFSLFSPDSPEKDMLGLLSHPNFSVNCKSLLIAPAEIPTQDFCFLYILSKNSSSLYMSSKEGDGSTEAQDRQVEMWKVKKLIKSLQAARGNGTSMISLIIPPRDQVSRISKMLADEYGTASNIKSRVNRLSVLGAITSTQQKLKLYTKVPTNGLVLYCGTILTDDGKEKRVNIDFEPFKPINTSLYLCDNKFHTEALNELLEDDDIFGFVVMDGNGCLYGTLQGNTREVLHKFTVDLPKKHGRGGQSALRFARLRLEKRHNYLRKCAELCTTYFITDNKCNVAGLVLAGSAEFKNDLLVSDLFDPRLSKNVIRTVDVSYGMDPGFNQAIELSAESLANVKLVQEKKLLQKYFDEISLDTGKYCFMVSDTLKGLDLGAVSTIIVWDNLAINRIVVRNTATNEETVLHLTPEQEQNDSHFHDAATGVELEIVERLSLVEWLANNYKSFGATLEFVTDRSQEGSQFCKGFGGIGGLLRWKVDFQEIDQMLELDQFTAESYTIAEENYIEDSFI